MAVIRISRGSFAAENFNKVKEKLEESKLSLVDPLKELNGLHNYYAAIDPISNSMINTSVWETMEDAKQMDTLAPMLKLAAEYIEIGINFERPIINFIGLWEI